MDAHTDVWRRKDRTMSGARDRYTRESWRAPMGVSSGNADVPMSGGMRATDRNSRGKRVTAMARADLEGPPCRCSSGALSTLRYLGSAFAIVGVSGARV